MPLVDCQLGENTNVVEPVNMYGCQLGADCFVGPFVEIQCNVKIGNRTRISSHSFVCEYVTIGDDCFIAHGVMFTNDKGVDARVHHPTTIGNQVKIGSNATILPVKIGDNCIIGAGCVVTKDVPPNSVVVGNPGRILKGRDEFKIRTSDE